MSRYQRKLPAAESITPTLIATQWAETNGDGLYQPDETHEDVNGKPRCDAAWICGTGASPSASGD